MKHSSPRKPKRRAHSAEAEPAPAAKASFPVVGIGASAGGLEAFKQLLQHLPRNPQMGFVLVQHLAPKHESALPELLSRSINLPVSEVKDGMAVEANHVYVIPPNTDMAISNGRLHLMPRPDTLGHHMPIDFFLRSLAADCGIKAIGIILSGTGSDGTLGMKAIKAEGGITFAQDAESAKYPGMPESAVDAGCVDFVLPPERIARELERIGHHPYLSQPRAPEALELPPEDSSELKRILVLLRKHSGVSFEHYKPTTIKRRVRRRMVLHKIDRPGEYVKFLNENPGELGALFQDILIHVTGFFRDPATFEALKQKVFPALLAGRKARTPIRIWVPGCSTGEEVYSIAIALLEFLGDRALQFPLQIFATDLSDSALEKARAGIYLENIKVDVDPGRLQRFFVKMDQGFQINKMIREECVFARHDLTKDPPFSRLDLISCRNLLIYLGPLLQKKVLAFFEYALKPGGFLLLGTSENLSGSGEHFSLVDKKNKIYSRKMSAAPPVFNFFAAEHLQGKERAAKHAAEPGPSFDLRKEVDRLLLSEYVPASVIVNEDLLILQYRGRTGRFLEPSPGQASLTLTKMAHEGLLVDLRAALHQARKEEKPARREGVQIRTDGQLRTVNIEVVPVHGPTPEDRYFLVLFEEHPPLPAPESKKSAAKREARRRKADEREMSHLQEELAQTKASLQSIIEQQETANEELRSANEEILSSNEELQSTNEELETAKEELQSTNEELTTLNEELQNRNVQLNVANSDLNNLLTSVNIPIIMVGSDLRIRRVTPMAERIFNIIPSDLGRPIGNIRPNLEIADLEELIRDSIENISTREREVKDREGRWYSLRVRPYRSIENKIDGAVLVLLDIDALKSEVTELRLHAEAIVETVQTPLILLDGALRVRTANHAFYEAFLASREETENHLIYGLGSGQWNIPRLRELLEDILPKKTVFNDFEVAHEFPRVGHKTMLLNARSIREAGSRDPLILLAIEDITDRKLTSEALRLLAEVIALAGEAEDTRALTSRCLETICKLQGWMLGQVWFLDEDESVLRCAPRAYYSGVDAEDFRKASLATNLRHGESLPGRTWQANSPQWITDLQAEANFARRDAALAAGMRSAFAFPISVGSKLYAIWEFFSPEVRDPDARLLEATTRLGNHLAVVYERRQADESLRALSARLIKLQDEERRRLARDLHDSTAQTLAAAAINLSVVGEESAKLSPRAVKLLEESTTLVNQASEEIRTLAHLLHPPMLDEVGLGPALRWYIGGYVRRSGIEVELDMPENFGRLPADLEAALYRIVQEGLTNIHRHSGSKSAKVCLSLESDGVSLVLSDRGKGLGVEIPGEAGNDIASLGVGIAGMRERVKQLGGRFEINSSRHGIEVKVTFPASAR